MHTKLRQHCSAMAVIAAAFAGFNAPPVTAQSMSNYSAVTDARLLKP